MVRKLLSSAMSLLNSPIRALTLCAFLGLLTLVLDGTLLRLWSLHRDYRRIQENIGTIQKDTRVLDYQIKKAKELEFVERQARDRFDMVGEDDLVFVFSNESD
jgi:cell division protein FtsB